MSLKPQTPPAACAAALAGVIGTIPGTSLTMLQAVPGEVRGDPRPHVQAVVSGWSPTLHRVAMDWRVPAPEGWEWSTMRERPLELAGALAEELSDLISIQRRRAAAGVGIGTAFPLFTEGVDAEVDHLHVDRGALAMLLANRVPGAANSVRALIRPRVERLHTGLTGYRGGHAMRNGGQTAEEVDGIRTVTMPANLDGRAIMAGSSLHVAQRTLPESLLSAIAGRRLGEVVRVHPALDGRVVASCEADDGTGNPTLRFSLEPDPVAVADLVDLEDDGRVLEALVAGAPAVPYGAEGRTAA